MRIYPAFSHLAMALKGWRRDFILSCVFSVLLISVAYLSPYSLWRWSWGLALSTLVGLVELLVAVAVLIALFRYRLSKHRSIWIVLYIVLVLRIGFNLYITYGIFLLSQLGGL